MIWDTWVKAIMIVINMYLKLFQQPNEVSGKLKMSYYFFFFFFGRDFKFYGSVSLAALF